MNPISIKRKLVEEFPRLERYTTRVETICLIKQRNVPVLDAVTYVVIDQMLSGKAALSIRSKAPKYQNKLTKA